MSDLISRQDAIDAWWHDEVFFGNQRDDMTKEQWLDYITDVIGSLPSADRQTVDKEYLVDLIQEAVYDGEACAKLMDLADRPTGEWVEQESDNIEKIYLCSNCENYEAWGETEKTPYCPNCGARMLREDGEE